MPWYRKISQVWPETTRDLVSVGKLEGPVVVMARRSGFTKARATGILKREKNEERERQRNRALGGLGGWGVRLGKRQGIPLGPRPAQCACAKLISSLLLSSRDPECWQRQRRTQSPEGSGPTPPTPHTLFPPTCITSLSLSCSSSCFLTQPLIHSLFIPSTAPINDGKLFQKILNVRNFVLKIFLINFYVEG